MRQHVKKKKIWGNFDPRKNKGGNDYLGSKIFFVLPFIMIVLNGNRFFFLPYDKFITHINRV